LQVAFRHKNGTPRDIEGVGTNAAGTGRGIGGL